MTPRAGCFDRTTQIALNSIFLPIPDSLASGSYPGQPFFLVILSANFHSLLLFSQSTLETRAERKDLLIPIAFLVKI